MNVFGSRAITVGRSIRGALPPSLFGYLRRCVTIDTRSLAAFRIVAALLIIVDVLLRSRNFHFYYTDDGIVTQEVAMRYLPEDAVSVFFLTNDTTLIAGLFALHALFAVVLLVGYKTRLATALSFLFVISLDHHNPFVLSYADTLFRMLLFWALFLPLGERWSIDAHQRNRSPRTAVASLPAAAIMLQMVYMYAVNAMHKFPSPLWQSGEAAIVVMGIDEMTFLLGDVMRTFPTLLQIGGRTWFYALLAAPLLILLYGRARYPHLLVLVVGHLSFALTVRIGAFAYVAVTGLLVFLQPRFWEDATAASARLRLPARPLHANKTCSGRWLAERLPGRLVDFTARDLLVRRTLTLLVGVAMIGLFVYPAFSLAAEGPSLEENPLPGENPLEEAAANWRIDQASWSIFAGPGPRRVDRYYVFPAETDDGEVIDVYNERLMTYDRPGRRLQRQHGTYRERFFMNNVRAGGQYSPLSARYVRHICETWPGTHGTELAHVNMYAVTEHITIDTIDDPAARDRSIDRIARHGCGDRGWKDIAPPEDGS